MTAPLITRRRWLLMQAVLAGVDAATAAEAVSSASLAHPEWDMDEERTWTQWQPGHPAH